MIEELKKSPIKDSGKRLELKSGAVRDIQTGKGRFDLLPWDIITKLAIHYEHGASKYSSRNWEKGMEYSVLFNSCMRHIIKAFMGLTDEDHVSAAIFNIAALGFFKNRGRDEELDDLKNKDNLKALMKIFEIEEYDDEEIEF